ncbi:MAG: hemerythrin domain-containing protein [Nitrospirota bacterium]|nr:hemerythrin domain-containing protein [Nitrospirota bacterium]
MDASLFIKQHHEIMTIAQEIIQALHQPSISPDEAGALRSRLVNLSGKVITHLAAEDNVLYPRLFSSNNIEVSRTAKEFAKEMGGIAEVFEGYIGSWTNGKTISERYPEFRSQSLAIFDKLADRIDREENRLYRLANGL